nr:unnamed protein product [Spirometra erinaceieuropaei]
MHKDLFYPLPCVWNLQLNDAANGSACLHSRSLAGLRLAERPNAKLLHMNRQDKFEYRDDDHLTPADVPATEMTVDDRLQWYLVERKKVTLLNGYNFVDTTAQLSRGELEQVQLLKRASAVLLPTETALVPPEAAADGIFELLVWNLLGSDPDAYTVVTLSTTSAGDARGHV